MNRLQDMYSSGTQKFLATGIIIAKTKTSAGFEACFIGKSSAEESSGT